MNEARLASALERCLQAIREGWSPEGALRLYPALRPELDGLLLTSLRLTGAEAVLLPATSHAAIRAGIMNTARQAPPARTTTWDLRGWGWRTLAAPFAAVVLAFAVFLAFASVRETEAPTSQTVLTILGGEVQVETARGLVPGVDGMTVGSGDRIVTRAGARAVLTFFDGSTVVIEPGSDVTVTGVEVEEGELRAALAQMNGSTWTHIPQSLSEAEVEIDTPSAHVETTQASVQTTVDEGGTMVGATDGVIAVETGDARAEVPSGFNATVSQPGEVSVPQPVATPATELVVRIEGSAFALISSPNQASVGTASPGVPVNQVPGARVLRSDAGTTIFIPNPGAGVYQLSVTATGHGPVGISASVQNGGSGNIATKLDLTDGGNGNVSFALQSNDLSLLSATTQTVAAAATPQVVVPQAAVDRANDVATTATKTATPRPSATPTRTVTPTATPTRTPTLSPTPTRAPTKIMPIPFPSDTDVQGPPVNTIDSAP